MTRQAAGRGVPSLRAWSGVEWALAAALLVLAAAAWVVTSVVAMPDMRLGILAGPSPMGGDMAAMSVGLGLFVLTWVVMMAAMMLPAITPFTVGIRTLLPTGTRTRRVLVGLTLGYLAVWSALGLLAYAVVRGFDTVAESGSTTAVKTGAVVLLVAGGYQFTPLKRWCLVRCRSPLALVMRHGPQASRGPVGAFAVGMRHGGYCVGCCWGLMAVLLAAGVMSLVWMAVIAAAITIEKVLPRPELAGRLWGAGLLVAGAVLFLAPGLVAM